MYLRIILSSVIISTLSACSYLTPPRDNPLLVYSFEADKDDTAKYSMAATDANRRVAILDIINGQICVEPPPEAANTISEAFAALFEADVKDKGKLGASLSQSVSQNISQLYRRTQTVQLYRDAVFALCQSSVNGSIEIESDTKANIDDANKEILLNKFKTAPVTNVLKEQINLLEAKGQFDLQTIDTLNFQITKIDDRSKPEKEKLSKLSNELYTKLKKSEFRRKLIGGLNEAYVTLKVEMPMFYKTEKLRFLSELGKPLQVCSTTYTPKKGEEQEQQIKEVTCHAELPSNIDKVIEAYVKALNDEKN